MAKICLCLTARTIDHDLEILDKYRKYIDIAELRADCLDPDERFNIRSFPQLAGLPVILSIRRVMDGGRFVSGEGSRISLLAKGLAFASADRRRNFAYVDIEEDLYVPSLVEAARTFGTRIIRSCHHLEDADIDVAAKARSLKRVGDEIPKVVVRPRSLEETALLFKAATETKDIEKIIIGSGEFGTSTRLLAGYMGSFLTYTTLSDEDDVVQGAPGQFNPAVMVDDYRFRSISEDTKLYCLAGYPLASSATPAFFNAVFETEKMNAAFLPMPADSVQSFIRLAGELSLAGASITVPYKEAVLPFLSRKSERVKAIGACNTVVSSPSGWMGYNTDPSGFSDSLLAFLGRKDLRGKKLTIIGSGGVAKAVAAEVFRLKGKALILNRTPAKAWEVAHPYKFVWAGLDGPGVSLMDKYNDIIIQATPVGMEPDSGVDALEFYDFRGGEIVMDLVYNPPRTKCMRRAEAAGCRTLNGYDMLLRQARLQYKYFTGKEFPPSLVERLGFGGGRYG
jgi:3-dehydroquinate dehydratase/shikimate dehydrogenase